MFRSSLAARMFLAIAATAVLIVAIMGLLVALSMRDGFARYLLRAELGRFDALAQALVASHDRTAPLWPDLAGDPRTWNDFVRRHFEARTAPPLSEGRSGAPPLSGPPPGGPPQGGPPSNGPSKSRPSQPDRPPGPPPRRPPADDPARGDPLMLQDRLILLGPDGDRLAGARHLRGHFEQRPLCGDGTCSGGDLLGYLALSVPQVSITGSDAFFLRRQYASLALAAAIAVLVSALAARVVARRILAPLRQLELGADRLASGDYAARIPGGGPDELGRLIGHYNALAATLERTDRTEREWISNTSHELQTPLATLRAQIEAVQDGVRPADPATLTAMHGAVMRLSRLVQDIRMLAHSREGRLITGFQPEDLSAIAREAADAARPGIEAKGQTLELDLPPRLAQSCDRVRIGQVLDNLLLNAVRYTNAQGRIRLSAGQTPHGTRLQVEDSAPGPSDADLPRLFDRFFRAEGSRSRVFGGSGLGLSVSRAIVLAHGGTITAGPSDLGGLRIDITLPKEPP